MAEKTSSEDRTNTSAADRDPPVTPSGQSEQLEQLRLRIGEIVCNWFTWLFLATVVIAAFLVILITTAVFSGKTIETMALAASLQVAFGMVIGFVCVYLGLMMTWFRIDSAYDLSIRGVSGKGELSLRSASPGLLFALGGIVLIAVSLYKPIVYEEKGGFTGRVETLRRPAAHAEDNSMPSPKPPPPVKK